MSFLSISVEISSFFDFESSDVGLTIKNVSLDRKYTSGLNLNENIEDSKPQSA